MAWLSWKFAFTHSILTTAQPTLFSPDNLYDNHNCHHNNSYADHFPGSIFMPTQCRLLCKTHLPHQYRRHPRWEQRLFQLQGHELTVCWSLGEHQGVLLLHIIQCGLYSGLCIDHHQGRQKLQQDIHQWQTQSRGTWERAVQTKIRGYCRMYSRSTCLSLKTHFSLDLVRNSELTSLVKTKRLTINYHKLKSPPALYAYFPNKIH